MKELASRYVFSQGDLFEKDFSILFKNEEKGNVYIPIQSVKELYLFNECTITTKLLTLLSRNNIIVHFFDYNGNYTGTFYPKEQFLSGKVTVKQAEAYLYKRLEIAKNIVLYIGKNIHTVLYHYYKHDIKEIKPYLDWLKKDVPNLLEKALNINQIMFIEGQIWSQFYNCFQYILPEDFIMNKRVRRPPDNPINALISFGNTFLYTKTISQIYQTHLNQEISFLHEPSEGRFSLCLDLCEVFKPLIVFRTIFECVNHKKITVEKHFDKNLNFCILNESGKKIFIQELDKRLHSTFKNEKLNRTISYQQAIKLDGYKLIKCILEGKTFLPFCEESHF